MRYEQLKALSIFLTAMMVPLGTYTGYFLASQDYYKAALSITAQTAFVLLQASVWWRTAELIGFRKSP